MQIRAIVYLVAIAGIEVAGLFISVPLSLVCHAVLVIGILADYIVHGSPESGQILPVLALAPLLRLFSFAVALQQIPEIYWYALAGLPFIIAIALAARLLHLSHESLGLRRVPWRPQFLIALTGLPLSLLAFYVARPNPIVSGAWHEVVISVMVLGVFVGFAEEFFFRGLLLQAANRLYGRYGILFSAFLFAIMYFDTLSWGFALLMGLIGLLLGWCVNQTRSIWGAVIAHGSLCVGMLVIWPLLWR